MVKLDSKFTGTIRKVKDGSLVPEEMWMTFLIKDNAFAEVLPIYRRICERMGADEEHLAAVDRTIARGMAWRKANPNLCKIPDAKGERLLDEWTREKWTREIGGR